MLDIRLVSEGDQIYFKNKEDASLANIQSGNSVEFKGKIISLNAWAKQFAPSGRVNVYDYAIVKEKNKTLSEIRAEGYESFEGMGFDPIE